MKSNSMKDSDGSSKTGDNQDINPKSASLERVPAEVAAPQSASKLFKDRPSMLSSEYSASSYRGFINLGVILLGISNIRLVVLNLLKYGILLDLAPLYVEEWSQWPGVQIATLLHVFILFSFVCEVFASKNYISERAAVVLQVANVLATSIVPTTLVWILEPMPASGILVMLWVTIVIAKVWSFAHVNHNLRAEKKKGKTNEYPNNLTLSNLYYFICAPTLCYATKYPRSNNIRKGWLVRRIIEAIFFSGLVVAIVEQYIIPLVHNSLVPIQANDFIRIMERVLKLSIPNVYVWLLGFYVFFHLYLNITAEILQFGDRQFYKDWWNSTTLQYFWKSWNMPVYQWMLVHVYIPVVGAGYSSTVASLISFSISAIFHELIVAVPFRMFKWWSLLGMLGQIPLIKISKGMQGNQLGNVLFWFSIVLGQPFLVLMIYRDWYFRNYADSITNEM